MTMPLLKNSAHCKSPLPPHSIAEKPCSPRIIASAAHQPYNHIPEQANHPPESTRSGSEKSHQTPREAKTDAVRTQAFPNPGRG
ncbi:hypothetical protein RHGRI_008186 [Rhododendron griersonianum]|uniref:Uncharacterized protein n=1 Tax=Rhododendron griersonianum TaxID=479676 RepID=A0AAV6KZF9_9ERIC|nr:hypothetical protein RHGRI_008186 [Rhododendron griersonianum]